MTTEENVPVIIISGNKEQKDYLSIIFKLGKSNDKIAIRYMDNYGALVDSLLFGLKKSFGWLSDEQVEKIADDNKKCVYFNCDKSKGNSNCTNPNSEFSQCTFQVRSVCEYYKQKDTKKFLINQVIIEKHGAIRGL